MLLGKLALPCIIAYKQYIIIRLLTEPYCDQFVCIYRLFSLCFKQAIKTLHTLQTIQIPKSNKWNA